MRVFEVAEKGGKLILYQVILRHMDPYYFYSGFSDRWIMKILTENSFEIQQIQVIGDYYHWVAVEILRTMSKASFLSKVCLFPSFMYYALRKADTKSKNALCMGYHVLAIKKGDDRY